MKNQAYVKHHIEGPHVASQESISALAMPKQSRLHRENKRRFADPTDYAKFKGEQLSEERASTEQRQHLEILKTQSQAARLQSYMQCKDEVCMAVLGRQAVLGHQGNYVGRCMGDCMVICDACRVGSTTVCIG